MPFYCGSASEVAGVFSGVMNQPGAAAKRLVNRLDSSGNGCRVFV